MMNFSVRVGCAHIFTTDKGKQIFYSGDSRLPVISESDLLTALPAILKGAFYNNLTNQPMPVLITAIDGADASLDCYLIVISYPNASEYDSAHVYNLPRGDSFCKEGLTDWLLQKAVIHCEPHKISVVKVGEEYRTPVVKDDDSAVGATARVCASSVATPRVSSAPVVADAEPPLVGTAFCANCTDILADALGMTRVECKGLPSGHKGVCLEGGDGLKVCVGVVITRSGQYIAGAGRSYPKNVGLRRPTRYYDSKADFIAGIPALVAVIKSGAVDSLPFGGTRPVAGGVVAEA